MDKPTQNRGVSEIDLSERLAIRLPKTLKNDLMKLKARGVNISEIARQLLEAYMATEEGKRPLPPFEVRAKVRTGK